VGVPFVVVTEGAATGGVDAAGYDLTALGWLQFEQLCTELAALHGVPREAWLGEADSARWATIAGSAAEALVGRACAEPVVVCVLWFPRSVGSVWEAQQRAHEAIAGSEAAAAKTVVLLTNAAADPELRSLLRRYVDEGVSVELLGRRELGRLIDAHRELWLAVPAALGVRRLDDLVAAEALADSTFDLAAARALAPTFVATGAYRRCCDVVARHGFAVLTGPPEMGKTAAARMLGLVRLCQGWEVHECSDPEQLWRVYGRDRRQMFIADDAFGSTEYRADAAERWARDLDRILKHMDADHVLVWTSRPAPLHAGLRRVHRENGLQRFPRPAEVMVDATDLTDEEKALMLYRHAVAADLGGGARAVIRAQAANIVADPHLTPERIRRLVWERLANFAGGFQVALEIARPTDAMAASLDALDPEHRDILVAMLDAPPAPVSERDLAGAVRRHQPGLAQPMAALVDRLQDHFLRRVPPTAVTWVHPSWRDLVIDRLDRDPAGRGAFLDRCGIEGALLALSVAGGPAGERNLPLLVEDADWDALLGHVDALVAGLDAPGRVRLSRQLTQAFEHCVRNGDGRAVAELDALGARVLEAILPGGIDADALVLLQEWYTLAELVEAAPERPDVAGLWVETLPTDSLDLRSPADVSALETWTALVALLRERDPAALTRFGFPEAQEAVVAGLFAGDAVALGAELPRAQAARLAALARSLAGLLPELTVVLRVFGIAVFPYVVPRGEDHVEDRPRAYGAPRRPTIVPRVLADLEQLPARWLWRRRIRGRGID
jgi:hypothetical protein